MTVVTEHSKTALQSEISAGTSYRDYLKFRDMKNPPKSRGFKMTKMETLKMGAVKSAFRQ